MAQEKYRDVMRLPHDIEAEFADAPRAENVAAEMGILEVEHKRRRNLLEHATEAEKHGFPEKAHTIKAAIFNDRNVAREWAAWDEFVTLDPSPEQTAKALLHVSHRETENPTLLHTALNFFCQRASMLPLQDELKFKSVVDSAVNAIRSRHIDESVKQAYLGILKVLKTSRAIK